jgi:hypothetical protein
MWVVTLLRVNRRPITAIRNHEKVLWGMHHVMRVDPRRRFIFGATIENTDVCGFSTEAMAWSQVPSISLL